MLTEDLLNADGASDRKDLPPLEADATFATYGRVGTRNKIKRLVAIQTKVLQPTVSPAKLIGIALAYGGLTRKIEGPNLLITITTIALSD
ncbi:hypothetical protein H7171_02785 [Candidatus Saccharibacteria bacterium]|nr:hypothetical protein [Candidatus Saccharibacteria bacterium]